MFCKVNSVSVIVCGLIKAYLWLGNGSHINDWCNFWKLVLRHSDYYQVDVHGVFFFKCIVGHLLVS